MPGDSYSMLSEGQGASKSGTGGGGEGSGSSNVNGVTSRPHDWPSFSRKLSSGYSLNELVNFP